jgi:hypothetical protein
MDIIQLPTLPGKMYLLLLLSEELNALSGLLRLTPSLVYNNADGTWHMDTVPGQKIAASAYFYFPSGTRNVRLIARCFNASGVYITEFTGEIGPVPISSGSWQRVEERYTLPANTYRVCMEAYSEGPVGDVGLRNWFPI